LFIIKLADINIGINCKYPVLKSFCRDYLSDSKAPDFTVAVTDEDVFKERQKASDGFSDAYLASICIYRMICKCLPEYGAFLLHSSVVELDGVAYAFSAPSGTGKSTHTSLWLKHFGDRAKINNGDKPILRFINGELFVYGTPWCGKEGYNTNSSAPLSAICFLEQGKTNVIDRIPPEDALIRVFPQILFPETEASADLLFPLLDKMLTTVPAYRLICDISDEAVAVAYNAMKGN